MIDEKDIPYAVELLEISEWQTEDHQAYFAEMVQELVRYWQSLDKPKEAAVAGVAHSILTLLDNLVMNQRVDYLLLSNGVVLNQSNTDLHEIFAQVEQEAKKSAK